MRGSGWLGALLIVALGCGGCGFPTKIRTPERTSQGDVIILPGVEGASFLNSNIAYGLMDGGVPSTIEVYDWTVGTLLFPVNLRFYWRNEREATQIAQKMVDYQDQHPGKPVHLVGHSGGGGIAIMALEALPPGRQITSAILLAPAVAPDYDLRKALRHTQYGIWNYYSSIDVGFLGAGTLIMGTIEGRHCSAAGCVGFSQPWSLDAEGRQLYGKLYQQPYTQKMAESGHYGGHMGWASRTFVRQWVAPTICSQIQAQARYASDARLR